ETICHVPHIIARGAAWFAALGTKTQGGTRMYSVSGRVTRPGVYEASVAITLRQLVYDLAGGVTGNGRLKAVVPGGSSAAILRGDEIDVTMDVDGLRNAGTMAGSAGVIVMDETVSIPEALMVVARFYAHESCGQCTPCRESTGWIYKIAHRIVDGRGRKEDLDTILDVAKRGAGTTICAFYDGAVGPYISYVEKFREELEPRIRRADRAYAAHRRQPPAGLPGVRSGGRVLAADLLHEARSVRPAHDRREGAQAQGGADRPARDAGRRALHPLLALRAVLRRDHGHRRARHLQPRRSIGDRSLPGRGAREQVLRQRDRHLPGRRPHGPRFPLPGA